MCGIVGIWLKNGSRPQPEVLDNMAKTISYRGPDDSGVVLSDSCGLAHQRLSIIDTSSAGHQPMSSPDGQYHLVFNGEIYNYQELKQEYLGNVSLNSSSDTEVLLHLLIKLGPQKTCEVVRGMFAFAFWDSKAETLVLARDPLGKKPLFFTQNEEQIAFASEPKALKKFHENKLDHKSVTS